MVLYPVAVARSPGCATLVPAPALPHLAPKAGVAVRILPGAPGKRPRTDHGPGPLTSTRSASRTPCATRHPPPEPRWPPTHATSARLKRPMAKSCYRFSLPHQAPVVASLLRAGAGGRRRPRSCLRPARHRRPPTPAQHDDGAVGVANLEVEPGFRRQGLASVMMDALYAAYPTAWSNHGGRSPQGTLWWDRYDEPAPERTVHNRPRPNGPPTSSRCRSPGSGRATPTRTATRARPPRARLPLRRGAGGRGPPLRPRLP
ncbi:hypothetical protein SAMN05216532_0515 [Streptomyces sp. 2231.1]|nr:hypothetical protein SAMN05216532_0515 [Streptomyces sp. 2231.1]